MIRVYSLLLSVVTWIGLVPLLLTTSLLRGISLQTLSERMGWVPLPEREDKARILIHTASVGEVWAAAALLEELSRRDSQAEVILTTGNQDGRAMAEGIQAKYPQVRLVSYLPWDRAGTIRSWLSRLKPDVVVVVETEIWPNLFHACRELKIPLCIVNGRIYERDFPRYRLMKGFFQRVLECVDWIGTLNESESERFLGLGANPETVSAVGDMKCDAAFLVPDDQPALFDKKQLGSPILVAGSTHPPEETEILKVLKRLMAAFSNLRLVLAPRHIRRAHSIETEARRFGFRVKRSSDLEHTADDWDVLVLDQIGKLAGCYADADLVLIGGSFSGHGGHNFLEAAVYAQPIMIGPDTKNFETLAEDFVANGGLIRLNTYSEFEAAVSELIQNEAKRSSIGQKARELLELKRGAARRSLETILELALTDR